MTAIRRATPDDAAAIERLVEEAGLPLAGLRGVALRFVAEDDHGPAGVAALEEHGSGSERALLLRSVVTRPDVRGTGVGAALVRAALLHGDEERAPIALLTETAERWFPRFGFRVVPRGDLPPTLAASEELRGACALTARAMLRPHGRTAG